MAGLLHKSRAPVVGVPARRRETGFSYLEVIIAAVVLVMVLLPALESLQVGVLSTAVHESQVTREYALLAKMEDTLARSLAALDTEAVAVGNPAVPTSFSDAVATPDRRLVFLSRYDGDNNDGDDDPFTGTDPGLLWVRVEIENTPHAQETLAGP